MFLFFPLTPLLLLLYCMLCVAGIYPPISAAPSFIALFIARNQFKLNREMSTQTHRPQTLRIWLHVKFDTRSNSKWRPKRTIDFGSSRVVATTVKCLRKITLWNFKRKMCLVVDVSVHIQGTWLQFNFNFKWMCARSCFKHSMILSSSWKKVDKYNA